MVTIDPAAIGPAIYVGTLPPPGHVKPHHKLSSNRPFGQHFH